ncbi:hypothetical protein CF67_04203 [Candidatus Photodesmus blepharus]|uniref:GTP cyclohydrolase 1 type 2 homolog n=1 Tax=Candidatus Photodesmus blepharonis TaxID=1179155 RepID=A0A084CN01_9GAMM|nr:Nif3-like dinuclear metal center hexameric protein [Candidatus Photodesmus blepharus]KEY91180.1 hypothetical protein CF67_04203 [Candidatus Photodesmus blepharus]
MNNMKLEKILNHELSASSVKDYTTNGMQIEGKGEVERVVTGVTASQLLIDQAVKLNADALLVHHGYFWKGEPAPIRGMKGKRIRTLIKHDINLYAYHLPLDIHPKLGNNAELARLLKIEIEGGLEENKNSLAMFGRLKEQTKVSDFIGRINQVLGRCPLHVFPENLDQMIQTVGWCTGGGQNYLELAAQHGLDAFISGEISERTTHLARELGIHYFSAGHHATERYGIKALGEWLALKCGLEVKFVDIYNPA